ncbi:carbohydrate kinase [Lewinella sp. JB7]|uniref:carbohydrate kinase family protein n=1 Tax=Lewinella sp. JB7 TaxID=2962887 RepID=UPI0020C9A510|nr:carbohydrate kinase [Lewinella sp. JB7]MCP9235991.1 carbohydrate kinase [Lewinella sp. JB7]
MKPRIICFGEVLWDLLPERSIIGGAPLNVAYHAVRLGADAAIVSRVGNDERGRDLLTFLTDKGVDTRLIEIDNNRPTGTVKVNFPTPESPVYEIVEDVAWDHLIGSQQTVAAVAGADALVFGSLACRSPANRELLLSLIDQSACAVFDVNLRKPFYDKALILELIGRTHILKVNDEELELISEWLELSGPWQHRLRELYRRYDLRAVILTMGARGAACLDEAGLTEQACYSVKVADTIGAGDTFLAAFLTRYLAGGSPAEALDFAAAAGAHTASRAGGTPTYRLEDVERLQQRRREGSPTTQLN